MYHGSCCWESTFQPAAVYDNSVYIFPSLRLRKNASSVSPVSLPEFFTFLFTKPAAVFLLRHSRYWVSGPGLFMCELRSLTAALCQRPPHRGGSRGLRCERTYLPEATWLPGMESGWQTQPPVTDGKKLSFPKAMFSNRNTGCESIDLTDKPPCFWAHALWAQEPGAAWGPEPALLGTHSSHLHAVLNGGHFVLHVPLSFWNGRALQGFLQRSLGKEGLEISMVWTKQGLWWMWYVEYTLNWGLDQYDMKYSITVKNHAVEKYSMTYKQCHSVKNRENYETPYVYDLYCL